VSGVAAQKFYLSIGDLPLQLTFVDDSLFRAAVRRYECFRAAEEGFPVFVNAGQPSPQTEGWRRLSVANARLCCSSACAHFDQVSDEYQMDALLRALLTLKLGDECGLLLHASAVLDRGRGHVFMGKSGAGKSTIAELSLPRTVFNDEISLVRICKGETRCYSTPFWGSWGRVRLNSVREVAPLAGFYALEQSTENRIEQLGHRSAVRALLQNQILFDQSKAALAGCLENASGFALQSPVFRLYFRREANVWDVIRQSHRAMG
jgi:hypothetical protein